MSSEQNWNTLVSLGLNNAHINNLCNMIISILLSYYKYIIIILQKCSKISYQTSLIVFPAHCDLHSVPRDLRCILCNLTGSS